MVEIIQKNEEQCWLKVSKTSFLNRMTGIDIKSKLEELLKEQENIVIIIDLFGITEIDADGYHQLMDVMDIADASNCSLYFSNVAEQIDELICNLTETSES